MATYTPNTFPSITYPPLTEGQFYITRPTLYVTIDSHAHDRVPPSILHQLLSVKLTKSGKPATKQLPEEERHFWIAQLVLYGLPHSPGCTKDQAKEIIKASLRAGGGRWGLGVPRDIKEIEGRLGKAVIKPVDADMEVKFAGIPGKDTVKGQGASTSGPRRKNAEKPELELLGSGEGEVGASSSALVSKGTGKGKSTGKETKRSSTRSKRKAGTSQDESHISDTESVINPSPKRAKKTARKSGTDRTSIQGIYIVSAPACEEDWPEDRDKPEIPIGEGGLIWGIGLSSNHTLFGQLNLCAYDAYLRGVGRVDETGNDGRVINFTWVGREKVEDTLAEDEQDQTGWIVFEDGGFYGHLEGGCLDPVAFHSVEGGFVRALKGKEVEKWESHYDCLPQEGY